VHAVTLDVPTHAQAEQSAMTFASVAEAFLDDVYGYLLYVTKDRTLAEDLTGETFETALRRWRKFDPVRGTARTWLLAIARSTALGRFRADSRRRRREERAGRSELNATDEAFEGFSPDLDAALQELTAGEREVIALRIVLDLDGDEAARLLGLTTTAVSTRLHRALGKLEERMTNP
jgi:RNA polymerase sigma-70 factor, ECF subfamily